MGPQALRARFVASTAGLGTQMTVVAQETAALKPTLFQVGPASSHGAACTSSPLETRLAVQILSCGDVHKLHESRRACQPSSQLIHVCLCVVFVNLNSLAQK